MIGLDKIVESWGGELPEDFKKEIRAYQNTFWNIGDSPNTKQVLQSYDLSRKMMVQKLSEKWECDVESIDDFNYDYADMVINLVNIEYCLKNNVSFGDYCRYSDYSLEQHEKGETVITLHNFINYYKGFFKNK